MYNLQMRRVSLRTYSCMVIAMVVIRSYRDGKERRMPEKLNSFILALFMSGAANGTVSEGCSPSVV